MESKQHKNLYYAEFNRWMHIKAVSMKEAVKIAKKSMGKGECMRYVKIELV